MPLVSLIFIPDMNIGRPKHARRFNRKVYYQVRANIVAIDRVSLVLLPKRC